MQRWRKSCFPKPLTNWTKQVKPMHLKLWPPNTVQPLIQPKLDIHHSKKHHSMSLPSFLHGPYDSNTQELELLQHCHMQTLDVPPFHPFSHTNCTISHSTTHCPSNSEFWLSKEHRSNGKTAGQQWQPNWPDE